MSLNGSRVTVICRFMDFCFRNTLMFIGEMFAFGITSATFVEEPVRVGVSVKSVDVGQLCSDVLDKCGGGG